MMSDLAKVQNILDYRFSDFGNLELALTAAGADEGNHDGNRRMAQMGELLIKFLLADSAYAAGASRADINENIISAVARKHRECAAKTIGIAPFGLPSGSCLDPQELLIQGPTLLPDVQTPESLSDRALQESIHNFRDFDQSVAVGTLCSSPGSSNANDAALLSPRCFDTTEIRSRDISDNECDQHSLLRSPLREMNLRSFATSPCSSNMEPDTPVSNGVESNISQPEVLPVESRQQAQEIEESGTRSSDLDTPRGSIAGSPKDISCGASRGQPRTVQTTHNPRSKQAFRTHRCRIEKSVQPHRSSRKPVQSTRRMVNVDNHHGISTRESRSGRTEDRNEASAEQNASNNSPHILQEKRRCEAEGYHYVDLLSNEEAENLLTSVSSEKQALILRSFLAALGGCDSLISLKHILQAYRESHQSNPPSHVHISSNVQRVEVIKRLGGKAAYCTFLKYCHIHKLFVENLRLHSNASDKFINSNAANIAAQSSRGRGNPVTSKEAQITKSMMQELYPDIQPTHFRYNSLYREISDWRKAGRRLERLVSEFDYGILGLLPLTKFNLNIAENIIFHLRDNQFQLLIEVLTENARGLLQDLGKAATPIIVGIFGDSIDISQIFAIENVEDDDIMGSPKGSPQLLELSSSTTGAAPGIT
ncbi:MAG: hypothetical protein Q9201_000859 [Fulgogasparrea decipioides]